jgi:putative PIN family toxin of toxin-antitoxin system
MKSKKVILDSNLWVSFLISKKLVSIDKLIENEKIRLIFSDELISEFIDVVSRPKFKKYFSKADIEEILDYFDQYGILVNVISDVKVCRDRKDNFLLNLSIDSKADYLITGDQDLLVLEKIEQTKILNFTDFLKHFE